jgi:hypothetical protein
MHELLPTAQAFFMFSVSENSDDETIYCYNRKYQVINYWKWYHVCQFVNLTPIPDTGNYVRQWKNREAYCYEKVLQNNCAIIKTDTFQIEYFERGISKKVSQTDFLFKITSASTKNKMSDFVCLYMLFSERDFPWLSLLLNNVNWNFFWSFCRIIDELSVLASLTIKISNLVFS